MRIKWLKPRARARALARALERIEAATQTTMNRGYWTRVLMGQAELFGEILTRTSTGERVWRVRPHPILERCAIPVEYVEREHRWNSNDIVPCRAVYCKLIWRKDEVVAWKKLHLTQIALSLTGRLALMEPGEKAWLEDELVKLDQEMEG